MSITYNHIAGQSVERLAALPQKVYHRKPRNMWGDVLYPLNRLKDIAPELYHRQRAKYDGRESLMQVGQRRNGLRSIWWR